MKDATILIKRNVYSKGKGDGLTKRNSIKNIFLERNKKNPSYHRKPKLSSTKKEGKERTTKKPANRLERHLQKSLVMESPFQQQYPSVEMP